MTLDFSPEVKKELRKIRQKDSRLYRKIEKQLYIFLEDPNHPSLRHHKLSGNLKELWSISITDNFRIVYSLEGDTAYFIKIGTHDEVYRK